MKIAISVFVVLLALIGGYFSYGYFASDLGQLIRNRKDSGISFGSMIKLIWNDLSRKFKGQK